jgi:hypothetical protein
MKFLCTFSGMILFLCTAGPFSLWAQSAVAPVDYPAMKKDLAVLEGVINTTIKQNITGNFPILASTKGTYLPEYGAVFSVEVNLFQIRQISPFSPAPHTQKELDDAYSLMVKRLGTLKEVLVKAIGEHGTSLQQLMPEQNLTVVMHLFNVEQQIKQPVPTQVIFKVKRSLISQYRENRISLAEFSRQMEIVQF